MRIWEKILCSWACAAYCQNCEPNSHALRAQTVVLRSDAMRAHSRIFKQMLILSCVPAAFYVIGNKKCRSKPINSFHAGGGLYLSTAFFMWHIQYSRKGSSMYKRIHGNFVHFAPPPFRQVFGKLAHCVRSNNASNLPAMLTKWTKLPTECLLYMAGLFLLYWTC